MYIRVSTVRFPNQTKADAWIALFQNSLLNKLEKESKLKRLLFFILEKERLLQLLFMKMKRII